MDLIIPQSVQRFYFKKSPGKLAKDFRAGSMYHKPEGFPSQKFEEPAHLSRLFERLELIYFLGAIASLAALATRNFTTVLALI